MIKNNENYNKGIEHLADLIKKVENPKWLGAVTGTVIVAPPNLEVKLESGVVIKSKKIMVGIEKTVGYTREYSIECEVSEYDYDNTTKSSPVPLHPAHPIPKLKGSGKYSGTGSITWTDTLKVDDEVLMLPTNGHEYFYLIDRVVRL